MANAGVFILFMSHAENTKYVVMSSEQNGRQYYDR
jgi:hypothetical protein